MSRGTERRSSSNMKEGPGNTFLKPTTIEKENEMDGWNDKTAPTGGKPGKIITSGSRGRGEAAKPSV